MLLGNVGLPAAMVSALSSVIFYREFILDGAYYPEGGIQAFPDALFDNFKEGGGEIFLSTKVIRIKIAKKREAMGVFLDKDIFLTSKYIVANCDARQLFFKLIGTEYLPAEFIRKIKTLVQSVSAFIVYLGLESLFSENFERCANLWLLADYNIESFFTEVVKGKINYKFGHLLCIRPDFYNKSLIPSFRQAIRLMIITPFINMKFWKEARNKTKMTEVLIKNAEKIIPDLRKKIVTKCVATPLTFYKYTLNYKGAISGWASLPSQVEKQFLSNKTIIKNLFLSGHWVTQVGQGGLPVAVYSGQKTARLILNNKGS